MKRKILILVSMFMLLMTGCSEVKYKELEKNLEGKIDQIANKIKEKSMENREEVLKNYYETTETKQVPEVIAKYILQDSKETFDNLKININGDIYKFEPYYISTEYKGNEYDTQLISKKDKKFNVSILTNLIRRKRDGTFKIYREVFITIRVKEENSKFLFDEKDYFIKSNYHQIAAIYLADNYNENWSDSKKLNCSYIGYIEEDKDKIITVIRAEYLDEDLAVKFTINKEIKDNTITITAKEVDKTEIKR